MRHGPEPELSASLARPVPSLPVPKKQAEKGDLSPSLLLNNIKSGFPPPRGKVSEPTALLRVRFYVLGEQKARAFGFPPGVTAWGPATRGRHSGISTVLEKQQGFFLVGWKDCLARGSKTFPLRPCGGGILICPFRHYFVPSPPQRLRFPKRLSPAIHTPTLNFQIQEKSWFWESWEKLVSGRDAVTIGWQKVPGE